MPNFSYIAKDAAGKDQAGVLAAENASAAARVLAQKALFPVRIAPEMQKSALSRMSGRIRLRDVGAMYSQLADLLRSGVPILRSLDILARSAANAALGGLVGQVRDEVANGSTFADALARHGRTFSELHVAMIRAGETAGFLEDVLTNLAGFIERQDDLRGKVRGAMIYPVLLAGVGVLAVLGVLLWLVPVFQKILSGHSLPLPSRILFGLSSLLRSPAGIIPAAAVAAVAAALWRYIRSRRGRRQWASWQLRLPVVGKAIRLVAITRFCRVLGTMLHNGVHILPALAIAKDATGSAVLAEAIEAASESVRAGESLAEPLRRCGLFPPEIIEMIAVGEESNQLEKVLVETADTVERRLNRQVDAAVRLVEPLMLMFMAAVIGFIALGIMYPVFTMSQTMR
jgi:general secretion pathway protein F/type IV pilus assembly protein PilC